MGACRANFGGTLLGMLAMVATPWLLASAWRGAWFGGLPNRTVAAYISTTILLVMLIDWGIRLLGG